MASGGDALGLAGSVKSRSEGLSSPEVVRLDCTSSWAKPMEPFQTL